MKYLIPTSIFFVNIQQVNGLMCQNLYSRASCRDVMRTFSKAASEEDTTSSSTAELDSATLTKFSKYYSINGDSVKVLKFDLEIFKPLGCTAEESLMVQTDGSNAVFIGNIVEDGNAQRAGLLVGDVIVGVSGNFKEVIDVFGLPLENVKGLIAGRQENEGLTIKVIRGSDVMAKHESALVDLCLLPENDKDIDNCIETMYKADYAIKNDYNEDTNEVEECNDDDLDCMLDAMFDIWGDELGLKKEEDADDNPDPVKKKPPPWSSRSSPSGTFVRDPKTGIMMNIDE